MHIISNGLWKSDRQSRVIESILFDVPATKTDVIELSGCNITFDV